ncbi:Chitin-binding lectin 1 [Capsicum chinense]|nr:Chitin-binding lectin 1 [Capsicum chinense]
MKEIIISLLSLALFLLKVSAKLSDVPFYFPANETLGLELIRERNTSDLAQSLLAESRCGWPGGGRSCPTGQCCDFDGYCGTGDAYCDEDECDFQCPGPIPVGRCGMQAGGRPCPTGQCCRDSGWCGSTEEYCNPLRCQSQCSGPYPSGRCGWQAGGRKCPTGLCCSLYGWCGTTSFYCSREECQNEGTEPSLRNSAKLVIKTLRGTKTAKELWGALERKNKTEDAGTKKFFVARFLEYKMIDNKSVVSQVQELQVIIHDLLVEGLIVNEAF